MSAGADDRHAHALRPRRDDGGTGRPNWTARRRGFGDPGAWQAWLIDQVEVGWREPEWPSSGGCSAGTRQFGHRGVAVHDHRLPDPGSPPVGAGSAAAARPSGSSPVWTATRSPTTFVPSVNRIGGPRPRCVVERADQRCTGVSVREGCARNTAARGGTTATTGAGSCRCSSGSARSRPCAPTRPRTAGRRLSGLGDERAWPVSVPLAALARRPGRRPWAERRWGRRAGRAVGAEVGGRPDPVPGRASVLAAGAAGAAALGDAARCNADRIRRVLNPAHLRAVIGTAAAGTRSLLDEGLDTVALIPWPVGARGTASRAPGAGRRAGLGGADPPGRVPGAPTRSRPGC
ncbi:hypothetical protein HBB16_09405 [Pseudonocardia sp. MCCB 268]|nr:hypothetical protein [Pseudonocardia cytotoxica]